MSVDGLAGFALFRELGDDDRAILLEHLDSVSLAKGRTLFRVGGESNGLVLVRSGELHLKSDHTPDECTIEAGGTLGMLSLASIGERETSAVALAASELWVLDRSAYRRLVDDHPRTACRLAEAFLAEVAAKLRAAIPELSS